MPKTGWPRVLAGGLCLALLNASFAPVAWGQLAAAEAAEAGEAAEVTGGAPDLLSAPIMSLDDQMPAPMAAPALTLEPLPPSAMTFVPVESAAPERAPGLAPAPALTEVAVGRAASAPIQPRVQAAGEARAPSTPKASPPRQAPQYARSTVETLLGFASMDAESRAKGLDSSGNLARMFEAAVAANANDLVPTDAGSSSLAPARAVFPPSPAVPRAASRPPTLTAAPVGIAMISRGLDILLGSRNPEARAAVPTNAHRPRALQASGSAPFMLAARLLDDLPAISQVHPNYAVVAAIVAAAFVASMAVMLWLLRNFTLFNRENTAALITQHRVQTLLRQQGSVAFLIDRINKKKLTPRQFKRVLKRNPTPPDIMGPQPQGDIPVLIKNTTRVGEFVFWPGYLLVFKADGTLTDVLTPDVSLDMPSVPSLIGLPLDDKEFDNLLAEGSPSSKRKGHDAMIILMHPWKPSPKDEEVPIGSRLVIRDLKIVKIIRPSPLTLKGPRKK